MLGLWFGVRLSLMSIFVNSTLLILIGLLLYFNYEIYEANTIILILMYSMSKIGILGALTSSICNFYNFRYCFN